MRVNEDIAYELILRKHIAKFTVRKTKFITANEIRVNGGNFIPQEEMKDSNMINTRINVVM